MVKYKNTSEIYIHIYRCVDVVWYIDFNWRNNGLKIMCDIYTYDEKFGLLSISHGLPSFRSLQQWNERERNRICRFAFLYSHSEACRLAPSLILFFFSIFTLTLLHMSSLVFARIAQIPFFPFLNLNSLIFNRFHSLCVCVCVSHGMQFIKTW